MTEEQEALLQKAVESISAARLLSDNGFFDIASSRAYYAMFYSASAMLLNENLRFRKHSGVHAAFGNKIARAGLLPAQLHGWLLDAAKARTAGDYRPDVRISPEEAATHVDRAERFLREVQAALRR
ncbi:MAG: HEPN domain-containing protein [Proteobacteria bacterium]|nr:HEPN domain-containing protein [Pseudomonadota bacterium]